MLIYCERCHEKTEQSEQSILELFGYICHECNSIRLEDFKSNELEEGGVFFNEKK